jgi:GNAT superfamily N-acetyltransferase
MHARKKVKEKMADMLVKLYTLPEVTSLLTELKKAGIEIRQAHPCEKHTIGEWVRHHFTESWAAGCEVALEQRPVSCYIAVAKSQSDISRDDPYALPAETLLGFACYDVASKGMFGPEGVREDCRGRGIGKALLLSCLHAMVAERYAYAVIGWAGPTDFYRKTVGATPIEESEPGAFRGPLTGVH